MNWRILLIVIIGISLRIIHIHYPIDGWHSWRQADTAAIARNFYEEDYNLFYPRIDWRGTTSGVVETEFPVYPFVVATMYYLFGEHDMWGRILSVIFSAFTIFGLFLLVRRFYDEKVAVWAAFIYTILPLNVYFSRAFMPESALLMCITYGLIWFKLWVDTDKLKFLLLSSFMVSMAVLLKLPTLYIGLPLLYLVWKKFGMQIFKKFHLWIYSIIILIPVVLWYYHAHQLYSETGLTFGIWGFGNDKWGNFNLLINPSFYNDLIFKNIAERHLTYAGFFVFLIGLFLKRSSSSDTFFDYWLVALVIYFLIVAKGNMVHDYYQLPFTLPASVIMARVFNRYINLLNLKEFVPKKIFSKTFLFQLCLFGILILSTARLKHLFDKENLNNPVFKLVHTAIMFVPKHDLVVSLCDGNPFILYHARRKGWIVNFEKDNLYDIVHYSKKGAKYVLGLVEGIPDNAIRKFERLFKNYSVISKNDKYFIVKLE